MPEQVNNGSSCGLLEPGHKEAVTKTLVPLAPRQLIEAARNLARKSRDAMLPSLQQGMDAMRVAGMPIEAVTQYAKLEQETRMNLVMDCYLTGCEEMLKLLHGDSQPEAWADDYSHEARLAELLSYYNLLHPGSRRMQDAQDLKERECR